MEEDFAKRRAQVTREWHEMVKPLFFESKEAFELFYTACFGYALRAESYGDTLSFSDAKLQVLRERTVIRRWTPEKPAFIGVKHSKK